MVNPENLVAPTNAELADLYSGLAEVVRQMPEGLPQFFDELFEDNLTNRGPSVQSFTGDEIGSKPILTMLNSSTGDKLVRDLPKYMGLEDIRPSFWEYFDPETGSGYGEEYVTWQSRRFGQRIFNYLKFGDKYITNDGRSTFRDITPYQELITLYAEFADGQQQKDKIISQFLEKPEWVDSALRYVYLQAKIGKYPFEIPLELAAFFYGHAPDEIFSAHQAEMIVEQGTYIGALREVLAIRLATGVVGNTVPLN